MGDVIKVTPDNARTALAALPRMVQLALGFASRLRRGTLDVTLLDGRVMDNCTAAAWGLYKIWRERRQG